MTDFHHSHLDAHPDDSSCRLLLAEWLDERGDPDAAGYRWMGERAKRPWCFSWCYRSGDQVPSSLPAALWSAIPGGARLSRSYRIVYHTRRDAESALCRAVSETKKAAETTT